jgi:hypothetical protein
MKPIDPILDGLPIEELPPTPLDSLPWQAPFSTASGPRQFAPLGGRPRPHFKLEDWNDVTFEVDEEWRVKGVLPLRGVALLYGKSRGFKSFVALHLMLCVAEGALWAGRRVEAAKIVYIAAEGAAGLRKRIRGYQEAGAKIPGGQFALISERPNLGTDQSDLPDLIRAIDSAGFKPGVIAIDTAAKAIGTGDENGAGMAALVLNAEALARHFNCLVLIVHHVGINEGAQDRPRGWSGLTGALDAQMLCKRDGDGLTATLTLQKQKDAEDGINFAVRLSRIVIGRDRDGDEVSTLIVDDVSETEAPAAILRAKSVPPSQRLLSDIIASAIDEAGEIFPSHAGGPLVRGVYDERVRERYYAAIAQQAHPTDDPDKVAERQRRAFNRAVEAELKAKRLTAKEVGRRRLLWLP